MGSGMQLQIISKRELGVRPRIISWPAQEQINSFPMPAFHCIDLRDVPQHLLRYPLILQINLVFGRLLQTRSAVGMTAA